MSNRAASLKSCAGCARFTAVVKWSYCFQSKELKKFRCSFAASAAHIQLTLRFKWGGAWVCAVRWLWVGGVVESGRGGMVSSSGACKEGHHQAVGWVGAA
jgi:hypothetical protein